MNKNEYTQIRKVNDGIVYIGVEPICQFNSVHIIGFNELDVCIDLLDENNDLIGSIYYKRCDEVYCEEYSTNKTITLSNNGRIINK